MNRSQPTARVAKSADFLRTLTIALTAGLISLIFFWQFSTAASPAGVLLPLMLTLPLWAPLRGLIRRDRRTYAWATLCVIPYFVFGITETIANPGSRIWSGPCLAMSLILFGGLIGYLRVTRP